MWWKITDWIQAEKFADDNFKFDENDRKFFKRIENTMGKGEIVPFQKIYVADREKQWLVWQRVERQLKLGMVLQVGGQHTAYQIQFCYIWFVICKCFQFRLVQKFCHVEMG